jgi:hypothetical protein
MLKAHTLRTRKIIKETKKVSQNIFTAIESSGLPLEQK